MYESEISETRPAETEKMTPPCLQAQRFSADQEPTPVAITEAVIPPVIPDPIPISKRSKRLPYLIMAVMFLVGLTVFLCIRDDNTIYTDPDMPWFSIWKGQLYFDADSYTGPEELVVPDTVAGQTVTSLSDGCFSYCTDLTTVQLPWALEKIGSGAFYGCTALRGVYIPALVTSIETEAFAGCTALESLVIPDGVRSIGAAAFEDCPKLVHIFYGGPEETWRSLYAEPIAPKTFIYTPDGSFRHTTLS